MTGRETKSETYYKKSRNDSEEAYCLNGNKKGPNLRIVHKNESKHLILSRGKC